MIEGLWTVIFMLPPEIAAQGDLNGGVAVIETGRLLGGDSGYYYVGDVREKSDGIWPVEVKVTRHDPSIVSLFGDLDEFTLVGALSGHSADALGRTTLTAVFPLTEGPSLTIKLTKVAELPG